MPYYSDTHLSPYQYFGVSARKTSLKAILITG
jgi:hypothetical protein